MKKLLCLLLALVMVLGMCACGDNGSAQSEKTDGTAEQPAEQQTADTEPETDDASSGPKELTVGYVGNYNTFCPSTGLSDVSDVLIYRLVYDQLFEVNDKTMETESRVLAEPMEWVDDNTVKLTIKSGITYADGTEMTAEDILCDLQMYVTNGFTEIGYYSIIDYEASHVEDTYTLYLVYTEANASAITRLAIPIVSKAFYEEHPDGDDAWWSGDVNGSGPYEVTDYSLDEYIVLEKRADYWDKDVSYDADKITIKFYADGTAMLADLNNGVIDVAFGLDTNMIDSLRSTAADNIGIETMSGNDVYRLVFSGTSEKVADINVRQAIVHAVDWKTLAVAAFGNCGEEAKSHYPSTFDCYAEHEGYAYDPEVAKQYLADAGYAEGELTLKYLANDTSGTAVGELLQGYLAEIGINLEVDTMELASAFGYFMDPNSPYDLMTKSQPGGNPARDPYDDFFLPQSPMAMAHVNDEKYIEMATKANTIMDDDERNEQYKAIDDYLYETVQIVPCAELLTGYAYNTDVVSSVQLCSVGKGCLADIELTA